MQQESARKILAASFTTPDGASRGAGSLGGAIRDKIGNTAVLYVRPDGKAKFTESKDWGAGRGALLGGAIGILGGPLGIIAGGSIGALVSKLRDSGFKNDQLEQLGRSLEPNSSAIVVEISSDAIDTAKGLLEPLGGTELRRGRSRRERCVALRAGRGARGRPRAGCDRERVFQLAIGSRGANFDRLSPRDRGGARGTRRPHDRREPARLHTGLCAERRLSNSSSSRRHALAMNPFKPVRG